MARRVLVFAEYGIRNGAENSWLAMARVLRNREWDFVVATPDATEFADTVSADFKTVPLSLHEPTGTRKSQQEIRQEFAQTIASIEPDLIHCNSLSTSRLCGPVTKELAIPAIGHLRDILKLSKQAVTDINCLDRIIAVSKATRDFHIGQGMDAEKLKTVHNGVDLDGFFPCQPTSLLKSEKDLPEDARLICCIGQIGMRKATDVVIHCFRILCERSDKNLHLAIVGQRNSQKQEAIEFEHQCHGLVQKSGLIDRVHFLGRRNDVASLLNESALLLHAARQEPLGRVLLEAAACGCPFVATDVGGTAEILAGLESLDVMCPVDDPIAMAERAIRLLNENSFHAEVSRKLRVQAVEKFDALVSASTTERLYNELVA